MRRRLVVLMAMAAVLLAAGTGHAFAAAAPRYDVQLWAGGDPTQPNSVLLVVSTTLDRTVKLPATVRFPLPDGADVVWSGEITGGPPDTDIPRRFEVTATPNGRVLIMTLQTTQTAQYEANWVQLSRDGSTVSATARWVQSEPASEVGFSLRVPAGVGSVRVEPQPTEPPAQNPQGERLYVLPTQRPGVGQSADVKFSYTVGVQPAAPGATSGSSALPLLIGVFVAAVAVVATVVALRRKPAEGDEAEAGEPEEPDALE